MDIQYLNRPNSSRLAYVHTPGRGSNDYVPLVFLGGYRSDMQGTKATFLEEACRARGQSYTRFDYTGHGLSGGSFEDGTIGSWLQDALDILDHVAGKPVVLAGSSMGGWIALLAGFRRQRDICGVVGIAAAPDFTEQMYNERLTENQRAEFDHRGYFEIPNDYKDGPYKFTKAFYLEAKDHILLDSPKSLVFPLRLIQGLQDKEVPWQTALKIQKALSCQNSNIAFIDDGDHRLSRPQDLETIDRAVRELCVRG